MRKVVARAWRALLDPAAPTALHSRHSERSPASRRRVYATASPNSERPSAGSREPSEAPNPQPPSGLGPEKDLARKTAPHEPARAAPTASSRPAHTQASLELARPRLELGTPRFSGTPERRCCRKSPQIGESAIERCSPHPRGYRRFRAGSGPHSAVEVLNAAAPRLARAGSRAAVSTTSVAASTYVVGRASGRGTGPAFSRPRPNDTTRLLAPFSPTRTSVLLVELLIRGPSALERGSVAAVMGRSRST